MKLISNELSSLLSENGQQGTSINVSVSGGTVTPGYLGTVNNLSGNSKRNNLLKAYLKRRSLGIVYMTIVLILLLTTSLFTDLGFNIGQAVIEFLGF